MTTLAAPLTAAYTTGTPNEFVTVVCSGSTDSMLVSWVGPAGTSGRRVVQNTTTAGEDIGPFLNNTTVTFTAQAGNPSYTCPSFADPVQALVSGGGVVPIKFVDFGDSYADLGTSVTGGFRNSFSWTQQLNVIAGAPFRTIVQAGVSGNTTTMMLARFAADVVSQGRCWVVIPAGTVNDPANGILPATAIANVTAMCVQAAAAGQRIILAGCPTNGLVTTTANPERRRYHGAMNAWARTYAAANGHLFADISRYSTDPTTGNFVSNYSFDSTHLSAMGALRVAQGVYADIGAYLPKIAPFVEPLDPYNLIGAAGLAVGNNADGTGGFKLNTGCTGTGPNGWAVRRGPGAVNSAVVTSTVTRTSGSVLTGSATFDPASLADGAGVTTTVAVSGAAVGDTANASFSLDLLDITMTAWVSAPGTVSVRFQNESGGVVDLASGTLRVQVFTVRAGSPNLPGPGVGVTSAGRLVYSATTPGVGSDSGYIDGRWMIGADGLSATAGRWNIAWGAGQTISWNLRRAPTVANGYNYLPMGFPTVGAGASGTTGGTEPLWPTERGGMVLDNGVLWMAVRIPLPGDLLMAEVEANSSAISGNTGAELRLVYTDTGSTTISTYDNFHTGDSTRGNYEDVAHGNIVLRTRQPLIVPAIGPLQIYAEVKAVGMAATSGLTLDPVRVRIWNASDMDF